MNNKYVFTVTRDDEKKRLDVFLADKLQDSRSFLKKSIVEGWVKVNGSVVKPNYKLRQEDQIIVTVPQVLQPSIDPENIPLDIIFEDRDIIVINKPRGLVVYPAPGNYSGTLINALLNHTKDLSTHGGTMRPGIVHRLDKYTSGVIVVAKNDIAHINLSKQLKNREVKKVYQTLVWGKVQEDRATINAPIGRHPIKRKEMVVTTKNSKEAITHFKVLERFDEFTFLEVAIETGRTHQIRVHMKFIGHPIVGDSVYSRKKVPFEIDGQALHAYKLGFRHPGNNQYMEFEAPLPNDMSLILNILRNRKISK